MSYLLDTNIISEPRQKKPNPKVLTWIEQIPLEQTFLSVISVGEIEQGIAHLRAKGDGRRANKLRGWLELDLFPAFEGRILPLERTTLQIWGGLTGAALAQGRPTPALDSLLAATAAQHHLTLVTRNTADIRVLGVNLLNPWEQ